MKSFVLPFISIVYEKILSFNKKKKEKLQKNIKKEKKTKTFDISSRASLNGI